MENDKSEQIYSYLSLVFGVLTILGILYLITVVPAPTSILDALDLAPAIAVGVIRIFSTFGFATTILSIINREKTSWIKVLGIILNSLILLFTIIGIILFLLVSLI